MKKMLAVLLCVFLFSAMFLPAYAAESDFVPSITYKDEPEVEDAEVDGKDVVDVLIITTIKGAQDKTTEIDQEDRDQLIDVYNQLNEDKMKLPIDGNDYVITDLVDVRFMETEGSNLAEDFDAGNAVVATLIKVNLDPETTVLIYTYRDGAWGYVSTSTVDINGYITCQIKGSGPVAFVVEKSSVDIPDTGDRTDLTPWIVILAISMLGIVSVTLIYRKIFAN